MKSLFFSHIEDQFKLGRPVLFLGAGFSLDAKNLKGEALLSSAQLTERLWNFCFPQDEFDTNTELKDIYETARSNSPTNLVELLKQLYTVDYDSCPSWYEELLTMPWSKIYTLNIDNLVETVLERSSVARKLKTISATNSLSSTIDTEYLQIIHLNGTMDDLPHDVVFSRQQYALTSNNQRAYEILCSNLMQNPVIFVGTTLSENSLWKFIEMRAQKDKGHKEFRPRSYLVCPELNKSKCSLIQRHNVAWIAMTGKEFQSSVLSNMNEAKLKGLNFLQSAKHAAPVDPDKFELVGELIQKTSRTEDYFEYLMGTKPDWRDLIENRVAIRKCFHEFKEKIYEIKNSSVPLRHMILTGTAGTGKTSALMFVAMELEAVGIPVAWLDANMQFSVYGFRKALEDISSVGAIFIDDADIYGSKLVKLVSTALEINPNLIVVSEVRSNKVDSVTNEVQLGHIKQIEYTIPNLVDDDIEAILDILETNKAPW